MTASPATLRRSVCWSLIPILRPPFGIATSFSVAAFPMTEKVYAMVVQLFPQTYPEESAWRSRRRRHARFGVSCSRMATPADSRNFRGTEEKFTYAVTGHAVDLLSENSKDEADEGTKQHLRTQPELTTKDTKYHQGMPTGRVPW
jgi:hypothetical protein